MSFRKRWTSRNIAVMRWKRHILSEKDFSVQIFQYLADLSIKNCLNNVHNMKFTVEVYWVLPHPLLPDKTSDWRLSIRSSFWGGRFSYFETESSWWCSARSPGCPDDRDEEELYFPIFRKFLDRCIDDGFYLDKFKKMYWVTYLDLKI